MTKKPTIFDTLAAKLGRPPTNAECRDECKRIIREAYQEANKFGWLSKEVIKPETMTAAIEQAITKQEKEKTND